jgi:hypothetical protein
LNEIAPPRQLKRSTAFIYLMRVKFLFLILTTVVVPFATAAQSPSTGHPRTVVDYYMLLPDKYFEANRDQRLHWMLDPKRGAIVDIANGYLYAPGDGAQTDIYTCIFKRSNGEYLVAVGYNDKDGVFETFLDFFVYDQGHLRNVTKTVLPVRFNKGLYYNLPRRGTKIVVTNTSGKRLYDLVWTGDLFRLKRA